MYVGDKESLKLFKSLFNRLLHTAWCTIQYVAVNLGAVQCLKANFALALLAWVIVHMCVYGDRSAVQDVLLFWCKLVL
jgi:hypothetical protein